MYDITRLDTFTNVQAWLKEVSQHAASEIVVYLIGNRQDEEHKRQVERETAVEFCVANKIHKFFETSALTGFNVEEVFSLAAKELYLVKKEANTLKDLDDDLPPLPSPLTDDGRRNKQVKLDMSKKKKKGCC